jgi:hypothetical protein
MKTLLLLCALISVNAFASQKAADLYQILKEAGIPEQGNGDFHMDQEKIIGIACQLTTNTSQYSCGLDRDDATGNPIRIKGTNAKKMYELLAPKDLACNQYSCGFFVDAVQCDYYLDNASPMSKRTNCEITRTEPVTDNQSL